MNDDLVDIDEALLEFTTEVASIVGNNILSEGRVIRDVFGKLSFVAPPNADEESITRLASWQFTNLSTFVDKNCHVIPSRGDFSTTLLREVGQVYVRPDMKFTLLDRRLAGDDWLQMPHGRVTSPPRIAFYGLKGGVGRSTALAVTAADFAAAGKNVLVIDLDLEAPGLGSILLRDDQQPDYGVLDWLAFESVGGNGSSFTNEMIGGSPFTTGGGVVDVVPAVGRSTLLYPLGFFAKLARAYTPGAASGRLVGLDFTKKIEVLIQDLLKIRTYDVVLLDVRAGLHETSAASILGLGAYVLLFGVASSQTISDYSILLSSVRQSLESWPDAADLRAQLRMVQGRAGNATGDHALYRTDCWQLWLRTLYDASDDELDPTVFSFDVDDRQGPHFPWIIPNSDYFLGFDPRTSDEYLRQDNYNPVFGGFLSSMHALIGEDA